MLSQRLSEQVSWVAFALGRHQSQLEYIVAVKQIMKFLYDLVDSTEICIAILIIPRGNDVAFHVEHDKRIIDRNGRETQPTPTLTRI